MTDAKRVPIWGKPQGYVTVEPGATVGAVFGVNLRWPNGSLVKLTDFEQPSTETGGSQFSYWIQIADVPANVKGIAALTGTGVVRKTGDGAFDTATTTADLPEGTNLYHTTERAQDAVGAAIAAGTGDGVTLTYDDSGNKINAANTDKGSVAVASHEAATDPHPQYLTAATVAFPASLRPAFLEQHISGFFGRGMLTAETINVTTEQAITGAASAGSATVAATDATNFLVGGCVSIKHANGRYGTYFVTAKVGSTLTIQPRLRYAVDTSSLIERTWYNRAHPGKFYMRELAQRIAYSTELEAAMPLNARPLFTNLSSNPNSAEDTLVAVGGASISYFDSSNTGSSGTTSTPVRFAMGRSAFITPTGNGDGVETPQFRVQRDGNYVAKVILYSAKTTPSYLIEVIDPASDSVSSEHVLGQSAITNATGVMQVYTIPFSARASDLLKVRVTATTADGQFVVEQIDLFDAPEAEGVIVAKRAATIVCLGDSWVAGDLVGSSEREPISQQLALELPSAAIINSGVGGEKVWDQLARFDTDVAPYAPDYVVVSTGTNECYNPASATFDPNSLDYFVSTFQKLIGRILQIGARPIIIGVPALAESDGAFASFALNNRAKAYAKRFFEWQAKLPKVYGQKQGLEAFAVDATITSGSAPSVKNYRNVDLTYGVATTITNLADGVPGQVVTLRATNGNVTIQHNANLVLGGANIALSSGQTVTLQKAQTGSAWYVVAAPIYIPAIATEKAIADADVSSGVISVGTADASGTFRLCLNLSAPTNITQITGVGNYQRVRIRATNGNATIVHNGSGFIRLAGSINVTMTADSVVTLEKVDSTSSRLVEVSRSVK